MFHIFIKPKALKQLQKIRLADRKRISAAIDSLAHDPFIGKKLEGELSGLWTVRVWPFRIVYTIEKKTVTVTVFAIGNRKDVYKKL